MLVKNGQDHKALGILAIFLALLITILAKPIYLTR